MDTEISLYGNHCMGNHGDENCHWNDVNKEIGKSTIMVGLGDLEDVCSINSLYKCTDNEVSQTDTV